MTSNSISTRENKRILVVDDNEVIHGDYRKVLENQNAESTDRYKALEEQLFGRKVSAAPTSSFELSFASQGQEALALVEKSERNNEPFAMAFVDVRMPPGWDGVETVEHLWKVSPKLQVVICTAYSDYSWSALNAKLGQSDQLLVLRKPFQSVEVRQMALALTAKWSLTAELEDQLMALGSSIRVVPPSAAEAGAAKRSLQDRMDEVERRVRKMLATVRHEPEAVGR